MKRPLLLLMCITIANCTMAQSPILNLDFNRNRSNWKTTTHSVLPGKTDAESAVDAKNIYHIFGGGSSKELVQSLYADHSTLSFLNSFSVQTISDATYISTELTSLLFGPIRLGIGGSFKTTGDTTKNDAIRTDLQKIITNGGNINMNFSVPLLFLRDDKDQSHFGVFALCNWGLTPNKLDTLGNSTFTSSNLNFSNQSGINLHFDISSTSNQNARLYFDFPITYNWGNTFSDKLSLPDFTSISMKAGIMIIDAISIHVSGPLYSTCSAVQAVPFKLTLQFSPKRISDMLD